MFVFFSLKKKSIPACHIQFWLSQTDAHKPENGKNVKMCLIYDFMKHHRTDTKSMHALMLIISVRQAKWLNQLKCSNTQHRPTILFNFVVFNLHFGAFPSTLSLSHSYKHISLILFIYLQSTAMVVYYQYATVCNRVLVRAFVKEVIIRTE